MRAIVRPRGARRPDARTSPLPGPGRATAPRPGHVLTRALSAALVALLVSVGLATGTAGAATSSVLCTGYASCRAAGLGDHGYEASSGTSYWSQYTGHNCTNYVAYRMVQAGMRNSKPWGRGNANTWGAFAQQTAGFTVGQSPVVGAIAWWDAGVGGVGVNGHVAYVESVTSSHIVISEDNYTGDFRWRRIDRGAKGWPSGFIHRPGTGAGPTWPPSDGTFLNVQETGEVYRVAGGAPVYVSTPALLAGQQIVTITAARLASLSPTPADGTVLVGLPGRRLYVVAGGAPLPATDWASIGGTRASVEIDASAIAHAGDTGPWAHLRAVPTDVFLHGHRTGRVYRVTDGHPYYVSSWVPYGGIRPFVTVDDAVLDGCLGLDCGPFGAVEDATAGDRSIHVVGWALDPDVLGPATVRVTVDGLPAWEGVASVPRPDLDARYHRGADYGLDVTFAAAEGRRQVCVVAVNAGLGTDRELGCRSVDVPVVGSAGGAVPGETPRTSPFVDVGPTDPFSAEIAWLALRGISTGTPVSGTEAAFQPLRPVSRQAMAAFLYRAAGSPAFAAPPTSPFVDVGPADPFYAEIAWLAAEGISTGSQTPAGAAFRPGEPVTRQAMAAFLHRAAAAPARVLPPTSPFVDVSPADPFYAEIAWLAAEGISTGSQTPAGAAFRPGEPVTRQAMAAFLHRLFG